MNGILAAIICSFVYILCAGLVFHFNKQRRVIHSLLVIWVSILPLYVALFVGFSSNGMKAIDFLNGILVYGGLFYCLSHPIVVLNTSLTISIMIMLEKAGEKGLSLEGIKEKYPYSSILSKRFERMVASGYLLDEGGYYRNTLKGELYARGATRLKRFLKCYPGG